MKIRQLFFAGCLIAASGRADTISVVGVVVRSVNEARAPGEPIGVYTAKDLDPRGKLGEDGTSKRGVYGVVIKNVSPEVKKLWVIFEGKDAVADPQEVDLAGARDDVRQAKAEDLRLLELPKVGQTITPDMAGKLVAAQAASNAVKVKAGVLTEEKSSDHLVAFIETLRQPLAIDPGKAQEMQVAVAVAATKEIEKKSPQPAAAAVVRDVGRAIRRLRPW